jgi:hypothetical protein
MKRDGTYFEKPLIPRQRQYEAVRSILLSNITINEAACVFR